MYVISVLDQILVVIGRSTIYAATRKQDFKTLGK